MANDVLNIDAFRGQAPAQAFRSALNVQEESLADGIGQSYYVVHYKGKVWSLSGRGERKNFVRPDDGTPSSYIDVIILRQARQKSKSFYQQYDTNASDGQRPLCSSIDGIVPDADSMQKQATACALCPRNEWKNNPVTGKKGRDCSDYKRLAVLLLPTQTQMMFGQPLMEPVFLRVPAGSLNDLATMGETMKAQGWHFSSFITRISFDPNEAHPKMIFRPLQALTDAEAPVVLPLRDDSIAKRITGEDNTANIAGAAQPPQIAAPSATPVVATGFSGAGSTQAPQPQAQQTQPVYVQPQMQVQPTPQPTPQPVPMQPVNTGFAGVVNTGAAQGGKVLDMTPQQPLAQQVQAGGQQTVADVGAPEEADELLDQRIAGLLKTA
jgi:hypothetical protein